MNTQLSQPLLSIMCPTIIFSYLSLSWWDRSSSSLLLIISNLKMLWYTWSSKQGEASTHQHSHILFLGLLPKCCSKPVSLYFNLPPALTFIFWFCLPVGFLFVVLFALLHTHCSTNKISSTTDVILDHLSPKPQDCIQYSRLSQKYRKMLLINSVYQLASTVYRKKFGVVGCVN